MQAVDAILFDPVGTLAEFPAAPFLAAAARVFARSPAADAQGRVGESVGGSVGGSTAYWDLLDLGGVVRPHSAGGGTRDNGRRRARSR